MPSSRPVTIPYVLGIVSQLRPRSILDVGVGFGKWGYLFREYADIAPSEHDPQRYAKAGWQVRIEGIEGHAGYLHPASQYVYDRIHVGDALEVLAGLGEYDVIFIGDVIEHFDLDAGRRLIAEARERAAKALILTTPKYHTHQQELCDNPLEVHRSLWTTAEFRAQGDCGVYEADWRTLVVAYPASGVDLVDPEWVADSNTSVRRSLRRLIRSLAGARRRARMLRQEMDGRETP